MAVSDKQGNEAHMSVSITEDYLLKYRDKKKPALDRAWLKKRTIHNEKILKPFFNRISNGLLSTILGTKRLHAVLNSR